MPSDAYIGLALVPGVGAVRFQLLLQAMGTAERVFRTPLNDLRRVPGITRAAATAVRNSGPEEGARVRDRTQALGGVVMGPDDPGFPAVLGQIPSPPNLLFVLGDVGALLREAVAIVGSRDHSRYGEEVAAGLAAGAATAGLAVVSGMARGIDAIAHSSALEVGGTTIGVLGNGLGVVYPAANRALYRAVAKSGLLLTEFPPGERPTAGSFPRRNRLISGLARVTVVVEAGVGSGALITADSALSQGREVMVVPGPITSPTSVGTNRLLQAGATPVLSQEDLLVAYGTRPGVPGTIAPSSLNDGERAVMGLLEAGYTHIDDVAAHYPGDISEVAAVLTSLEIRGIVVQESGKHFRRTTPRQIGAARG